MRVVGWTRSGRSVEGVEPLALDALLETSDFVSVHVALAPETRKGCGCGAKGGSSLAGSATTPGWAFFLLLLPLLRRRR